MKTMKKKIIVSVVMLACLVSFTSCGYFLYPERRGQSGGEIDIPILLLDCGLLLFFIVPGVIALAVDLTSGCIYLPGGKQRSDITVVHFNKGQQLTNAELESIVAQHTGERIRLNSTNPIHVDVDKSRKVDVEESLKYLNAHINDRIAITNFAFANNYAMK